MKNLIGNAWKSASTKEYVEVRNPYNHKILDTIPNSSYDDVNEAVKVSDNAIKYWTGVPINERCEIMLKFVELVRKDQSS